MTAVKPEQLKQLSAVDLSTPTQKSLILVRIGRQKRPTLHTGQGVEPMFTPVLKPDLFNSVKEKGVEESLHFISN